MNVHRRVLVFVLAFGAVTSAQQVRPESTTVSRLLLVQRWVHAVEDHTPGRVDDAAQWVQALTPETRKELTNGLAVFLHTLVGRSVTTSTPESRRLAELGRDKAQVPGVNPFLGRAAVLHADVAIATFVAGGVKSGNPSEQTGLVRANDGEFAGIVVADWNWPFARGLLEQWRPSPLNDPFVAQWYHATTAAMLQIGHYGEANPHLVRAGSLLPEVAAIAFDRAVYTEGLTLPRARQVLEDPRTVKAMAGRDAALNPGQRTPIVAPPKSRGPAWLQDLAEAERLLRRTLALDPSLVEARVRLGRIFSDRGRHDDALKEFTAALAGQPDRVTSYYAHLFAGRSARVLGALEVAAMHLREARALFPDAQSALVADSQLALVRGDAAGAVAPMRHLAELSPDTRDDPWWQYPMGAGRDAEQLLRDLWKATLRLSPPTANQ